MRFEGDKIAGEYCRKCGLPYSRHQAACSEPYCLVERLDYWPYNINGWYSICFSNKIEQKSTHAKTLLPGVIVQNTHHSAYNIIKMDSDVRIQGLVRKSPSKNKCHCTGYQTTNRETNSIFSCEKHRKFF